MSENFFLMETEGYNNKHREFRRCAISVENDFIQSFEFFNRPWKTVKNTVASALVCVFEPFQAFYRMLFYVFQIGGRKWNYNRFCNVGKSSDLFQIQPMRNINIQFWFDRIYL